MSVLIAEKNVVLDIALRIFEEGIRPIVLHKIHNGSCTCRKGVKCPSKGKHPIETLWGEKVLKNTEEIKDKFGSRKYNLGIPTGPVNSQYGNDLIVLDFDGEEGEKTFNRYRVRGLIPPTWIVRTGSGGFHVYLWIPSHIGASNSVKSLDHGLDIRATGGLVVGPGSENESGHYNFMKDFGPSDVDIAEATQLLIESLQEHERDRRNIDLSKYPEVENISVDFRFTLTPVLIGKLESCSGFKRLKSGKAIENPSEYDWALAKELLKDGNFSPQEICECLLGLRKIERKNLKYEKYYPMTIAKAMKSEAEEKIFKQVCSRDLKIVNEYELTELGNSMRFIDTYKDKCFYVFNSTSWYLWNGQFWEKDSRGKIISYGKEIARKITEDSRGSTKDLMRHAKLSESRKSITNMLFLAQPDLAKEPEELDSHSLLLNVQNGTINLETGELLAPDPQQLLTQTTSVKYDTSATCPVWLTFLDKIMGGDQELVNFLQRAVGYSLTGLVREQCIFFLYGTGSNGKSTFLDTLQKLMDTYSKPVPSSALMENKYEKVNNDIAGMKSIRFVITSEGKQSAHLDESLIKQLTGGDKRSARFLFKEYFEYIPTDKIWFMTNHKPVIKETDDGIWRRICNIPFDISIPEAQRDLKLSSKLEQELPGILNWALEGCMYYLREGLKKPQRILDETATYRADMDLIKNFISDTLIERKNSRIRILDLYPYYTLWCYSNGLVPLSKPMFSRQMRARRDFRVAEGPQNKLYLFDYYKPVIR